MQQARAKHSIIREGLLLGPGPILNQWSFDSVLDTEHLDQYYSDLAAIVIER
jgi:hypothetical protein